MKNSKYSVVIIGSGVAGLYAALKIEQQVDLPNGILLVTKTELKDSNSYFAQGGMVAVLNSNTVDSVELHISDTLKAGAGLSELNTIKFISENSDKVVKDLLSFGVEFDKDKNGDFTLTKEAAHSVRRILHSGGDATGREMEIALCRAVQNNPNITIARKTIAVEILTNNKVCNGLITYNSETKEYTTIQTDTLVIATGGIGQLYKNTTNPKNATGDGIALCYRAGADLQDMEFVQFHPTALAIDGANNRFLITEALRGEGAKLCNEHGIEFMQNYHEKKELAPRDIVARSISMEMNKTNCENVFLSTKEIPTEKLLKRFPTIALVCKKYNIDITKDLIPVAPAAHYFMGGVKTNLKSETSIKNLYAIGEVASTGLHGANRLASNSLLECVVCAYEIANVLKEKNNNNSSISNEILTKYDDNVNNNYSQNLQENKKHLQTVMWDKVGIFRTEETLNIAEKEIQNLKSKFKNIDKCSSVEEYEYRNMLIVAELIVKSAKNRKESRGAHYRLDYLNTDSDSKHSIINKNEGEICFVK